MLHEILQSMNEQKIIIDGDDDEIQQPTDTHQILQIMEKDSDHVIHDGMYLVDESEMH